MSSSLTATDGSIGCLRDERVERSGGDGEGADCPRSSIQTVFPKRFLAGYLLLVDVVDVAQFGGGKEYTVCDRYNYHLLVRMSVIARTAMTGAEAQFTTARHPGSMDTIVLTPTGR